MLHACVRLLRRGVRVTLVHGGVQLHLWTGECVYVRKGVRIGAKCCDPARQVIFIDRECVCTQRG